MSGMNEKTLKDLVGMLIQAQSGKGQNEIYEKFEELNSSFKDFNNYLVHIFAQLKNVDINARKLSGILLKNNIKIVHQKMTKDALSHIKQNALAALGDSDEGIRLTAGNIISNIVHYRQLKDWPDLLDVLIKFMQQNGNPAQEGAFSTCVTLVEDNYEYLESVPNRPLNTLVPVFIKFFQHPQERMRKEAINAMLICLEKPQFSNAIIVNMDNLLNAIFGMAQVDKSEKLKKRVCTAFSYLLKTPEYLKNHLSGIFDYVLSCQRLTDSEELAKEATAFWSELLDVCKDFLDQLETYLPKILPLVLKNMVYSEVEREYLEASAKSEKEQQINPSTFHSSTALKNNESDEDSESDPDDYEEEEDGEYDTWSLRKASSSLLDTLSKTYGVKILPTILPIIQETLKPQVDWWVREAGILALGAVSQGCQNGLEKFLPELIGFLVKLQIEDKQALVKSAIVWTLGRYSSWVAKSKNQQIFEAVLKTLLERMNDRNRKTQESASSSLVIMIEKSQNMIVPYLKFVIPAICKCFTFYPKKNEIILYEAYEALADCLGADINKQEFIQPIMEPLMFKWKNAKDDDPDLIVIMECLTSVAAALKTSFKPFAKTLYTRCLSLIEQNYIQDQIARESDDNPVEKDNIMVSLELISGMAEGLGSDFMEIGTNNLPKILLHCMKDPDANVRHVSFAVLGELAKRCLIIFKDTLRDFIGCCIKELEVNETTRNNACWALGEITLVLGANDSKSFLEPIIERLVPIFALKKRTKGLTENSAALMGRMAYVCPDVVAPHLEKFAQNWFSSLKLIRHEQEREQAFKGLCLLVRKNAKACAPHFQYLCDAIASYHSPPKDIAQNFYEILQGFKQSVGSNWSSYFDKFPDDLKEILTQRYRL